MSSIDFQNGFLCGLATRGMITTGKTYDRFIEINVFDGYRVKNTVLSDSATPVFDTTNNSQIVDTLTLSSCVLSDGSEVILT